MSDKPVIILVEPQLGENIGMAARGRYVKCDGPVARPRIATGNSGLI